MMNIKDIVDSLLGKPNMDKYPLTLILGLLILSINLKFYYWKYNIPEFEI